MGVPAARQLDMAQSSVTPLRDNVVFTNLVEPP